MTIRALVYHPDPRLRQKTQPVVNFDESLHTLIEDMFETMYHNKGVGLAAPQIGINLRLSVVDVMGDKSQQLVLANPEIIHGEGDIIYTEGCLSVPGAYDKVKRADKVIMHAQDRNGKSYEMTANGLLGECFQHEIDHLNGKLFIDLLSPIKRTLALQKLNKYKRENKASR
jgi:peptide deformylase